MQAVVEMELLGVRLELPTNNPIVLLKETGGRGRVLPIFIGGPEATAIALALDGVETPRPMTHDLLVNLLGELGASLERVVVTDLAEGTFFADLHLRTAAGEAKVSSRPSDAIAVAVRVGAPIFAEEHVLDEAAAPVEEEDEREDMVEEFRRFIETVDPEDFAS